MRLRDVVAETVVASTRFVMTSLELIFFLVLTDSLLDLFIQHFYQLLSIIFILHQYLINIQGT